MSVFIFLLPLSASLWIIASGGLIMYNPREFLLEVMENDGNWADILNIEIKIEMSVVSNTTRLLLEEMRLNPITNNGHTCQQMEEADDGVANSQKKKDYSDDFNTKSEMVTRGKDGCTQSGPGKCKASQIVISNALLVLAHIVSMYDKESNTLEFGLAVFASAIRCQILQLFLIMLWVLIETPVLYNKPRYIVFWDQLGNYLDKLSRVREDMKVESDIYREWVSAMTRNKLNDEPPKAGNLKPIQRLMTENLKFLCECDNFVKDKITDIMNSEINSNDPLDKKVFDYAQESLKKLFQRIPISTMGMDLWDNYLNKEKSFYHAIPHRSITID